MDPTFGLADKFRDLVLDQIWEQFLYLVCYGQNIEQLTEQLVKLTLRREAIQHRVDEARNNVKQIEGEVLRWLDEVDTIFKQVEQLHKESQAKRGCSITSCSNPWLRYKLSKSAKEMVQEVSNIYEGGKFDRVSCDVPPPPQVELPDGESSEGIDSRVLIMNQIMEALRNPSINMIGLCGSGGVGKTTLVKEVEMKELNHKMFGKVIRTTISDEVNIKNIQGHIAEKLGMQLNENFEDTRACRLCERLKQEKNMLLILDDLWLKLDLHKVGIPLVEGHKILLTSRNETLLSTGMKCQEIIKVGVLLEDEALELFKRIAKLSFDSSNPDLISIATEIVRRCQGLPLAIATAAKALEENDLNGWKDYLERLKHLRRNYTGIKEVDASLKLSYDPLSQENKNIFLLSAMLSHYPSIEDLLMYSVGLDFLEGIENMEEAHVRISTIVSKLQSLNLFLSGSSNHGVMIHDVFREVALSIAPDELHAFIVRHKALKEWPDELEQERYKGICLQQSDIGDFPEELYGPRLEFFMLNSTKHDFSIPSMFFKSSKELKVLAFTNMHFPSLPSLSFLKKLKALCLHSCVLVDIIEVGCLRKLKVLSLANSEIERLPVQLAELTSLLMLNLSHCNNLKVIPPGLLSSLKKLEVLYMGNSFNQWKVEGCSEANNENASLEELRDLPISSLDIEIPNVSMLPDNLFLKMNLSRYRILIGKSREWQANYKISKILKLELESSANYQTSKILKLKLESSIHLKGGFQKLLEGVEDLYLYGSNALENVLPSHEGSGFTHLRLLRINGNYEAATKNVYNKTFKSIFNKKVLLPMLEILELSNILKTFIPLIWDDQLSHNSFNNLKLLIVESCDFEKLVPLHVLKSLNNLEELKVVSCNMLEIVFDFEDLKDDKEIESSPVVVPLKKLKLQDLPKLKNVWSNHHQGIVSFPSLRSVYVKNCGCVKLVPLHVLKSLNNLEKLEVWNCNMLKKVFDFEDLKDDKEMESSSVVVPLKKLKLMSLPKLKNVFSNNCQGNRHAVTADLCIKDRATNNTSNEISKSLFNKKVLFRNLEEVEVVSCRMLEIVFDFEDVNDYYKEVDSSSVVVPLKKLKLESLPKLKNVWSNNYQGNISFPSLRSIDVLFCESLTSIFHAFPALQLPRLTSLQLGWLPQLTSFYPQRHTLEWPHLQRLSIQYCEELEIFEKEVSSSSEIYEEESTLNSKYPLFAFHRVIQNLEELDLRGKPAEMIGSGHFSIYHFPKVKQLSLSAERATTILYRTLLKSFPNLEELQLRWHFAEAVGGDDVAALPSPFPKLTLRDICIIGILSPLLVSSPNLTHIEVISCHDLTTLMTSSTARSLVHLTHLTISRCNKIEEIIMKQEGENDEDKEIIFDKLKILVLEYLPRLKRFCGYNYPFRFPLLDQLVIKECPSFKVFSPGPIDTPFLESIQLSQHGKKQHEVRDADLNRTFYQQRLMISRKVALDEDDAIMIRNNQFPADHWPQVEILRIEGFVKEWVTFPYTLLERFPKLNELHVEKSSFEIFPSHAPSSTSFHNLAVLKVFKCHQLVYLVTCSTVKSFVNLKTLEIDYCEKMEEIVRNDADEDVEGGITFNGLRILKLTRLPRLKTQEDKKDFNIEDRATDTGCTNIPISLFSHNKVLFPNLEELEVRGCDMLEIVFDFEDVSDYYNAVDSSSLVVPLKKLMLWGLPKLKNVWSNNYQGNISFPNLRSIHVSFCESLTSIFPAFPAPQFPSLTSLELYSLPQLTSFYPQRHTLEWPHLQRLSIKHCDGLEIFEKEASSSEIHEEESTLNSKYPLFSDKVIHNLEELDLEGKPAEMIGSGQFPMYHFPKVKQLYLFAHNATTILYRTVLKSFPNLEELHLSGDFAVAFGGDDVATLASPFPKLILRVIRIRRSLSPLLVSSPNLTHIEVICCADLTALMTSSTARSLVHLTHLTIGGCDKMEEIITKQEGENDEDKEIVFNKLKILELHYLPRLKRFCGYNYTFRFPLLDQLVIEKCPSFKIFSLGLIDTPFLESIQLSQDGEKQHVVWDADLNKTFYQQRLMVLRERLMVLRELVLDEDDAIMIRNDQFLEDGCPQVEILRIKGFVDEWVTFPYTLLERFPKLNTLHVENCSFEKIFPSHAPSSTSFHNLTVLIVSKCHHLVYLVTCSVVKSLVNLETLEIDECEKLEEIVRNETDEDVERGITFNGLRILKLTRLPKLKTQEDKKDFHIEDRTTNTRCTNISRSLFSHNKVLFPKLETLQLSNLLMLSLIWDDQHLHNSFSHLKILIVKSCDFMKLVPFHVLKSLNNLEKLEVSNCDKLEMVFGFEDLNDYHKEMESSSVVAPLSLTHLEVKGCRGLTTLMTSSAPPSLVHITHLSISNCNQIEEIITKQEGEDNEEKEIFFNQMKFMELDDLPRLKRFCGYNYTFRFPLLEHIAITKCPQLTMFCLGAIHAPQLQSVRVSKYGPHKNIWKTNLNNTIQHLFTFEEVTSTCTSMALNSKNITTITNVFPVVDTLYVESFMDEGVTFPYSSLERFPHLYNLYVEHCSFGEIFPSQDQIIDFKGKISPFKHLWRLSISGCHQLIHLVTTSTVKSLVSLQRLEINDCKKMEEIVKNDTNEDVQGGMTFNQLREIKLTDMPSLKMFSSQSHTFKFPTLEMIKMTGCPEMKLFCRGELKTPKLSKVKIEEHDMEWKDEGNLNKTMEGLSSAKDSFNI